MNTNNVKRLVQVITDQCNEIEEKDKLILEKEKLLEDYKKLINQQRMVINELNDKVYFDTLTGLYNRRILEELKNNKPQEYTLLLFDIDNFKMVNDVYGHDEGDRTLMRIASLIKETCKTTDKVIRLGGDEMVALLYDCNEENAYVIAKRIQEKINKESFESNGESFKVNISIGIKSGNDFNLIESTLKQADIALYQSKENGKNEITIYKDEFIRIRK